MADSTELTSDDLEAQAGAALPDKEAMSTVRGGLGHGIDGVDGIDNFAMPINQAIAVNNESVDSYAIADADQIVMLEQTDVD